MSNQHKLLTNEGLLELTKKIADGSFHRKFKGTIKYNNRLTRTGGYTTCCKLKEGETNIDISFQHAKYLGKRELVGIIKHELCHYFLYIDKLPCDHKDATFISLAKQAGAPLHCGRLNKYLYYCPHCKAYRVSISKFQNISLCGKCSHVVSYIGKNKLRSQL